MKLQDYIFQIRSQGGYTFNLNDLRKNVKGTNTALSLALNRARLKGKIVLLRKGFYCIIPPEFSKSGMLPVSYFIDDLMLWLTKPYYLSLFSAAAIHGAGHQQPMENFVITKKPVLRSIHNDKLILNFLIKKQWEKDDIISVKTDMGYIQVSSPELTALDLLYYLNKSGINRVVSIIDELAEIMNQKKLKVTAKRYPWKAPIQRLGYLLDCKLNHPDLAESLRLSLNKKRIHYIPLSIHHIKKGEYNSVWKVIRNIDIETDQ